LPRAGQPQVALARPGGGARSAWDDAWRFSLMPAAWKIPIAPVES